MSSLNSLYIKKETLKTLFETLDKKGEKGIEITIPINDEANQYNQNISAYVSQSKEDREAKKERYYVGNGKTFWTNGIIVVPEKDQPSTPATPSSNEEEDDLPF